MNYLRAIWLWIKIVGRDKYGKNGIFYRITPSMAWSIAKGIHLQKE